MPPPVIVFAPLMVEAIRAAAAFLDARNRGEETRLKAQLQAMNLRFDHEYRMARLDAWAQIENARAQRDERIAAFQRDVLMECIAFTRHALDRKVDALTGALTRMMDHLQTADRNVAEQIRRLDKGRLSAVVPPYVLAEISAQQADLRIRAAELAALGAVLTAEYSACIMRLPMSPELKAMARLAADLPTTPEGGGTS